MNKKIKIGDQVKLIGVPDWLVHDLPLDDSDHVNGKPGPKASRKFDQEALRREVEAHPDALLRELAASRGVKENTIFRALKRLGIVRKKNSSIRGKSEISG